MYGQSQERGDYPPRTLLTPGWAIIRNTIEYCKTCGERACADLSTVSRLSRLSWEGKLTLKHQEIKDCTRK
jgi:hypothetical protein